MARKSPGGDNAEQDTTEDRDERDYTCGDIRHLQSDGPIWFLED